MQTYISLFSSAGVGCFGFKQEGFECIATNELIERRLKIQKYNNKCKYESGYICGDITKDETKKQIYDQIDFWKKNEGLKQVDVLIATPPCQGMSVANHKKNDTDLFRNSLVIESIKVIKKISPKFFVFENVPAFMKTICTDIDGVEKSIEEAIFQNLGKDYSYYYKVLNFKNYGSNSSRKRTLLIGVENNLSDEISPLELFPTYREEKTLREVIGDQKRLNEMSEIDSNDIYHFFRPYPNHMRSWISSLKEGQSAFDNAEDRKKPHQIIDGKLVINDNKNADKYTRQYWDKVGPCVHTRNDQLASQNTIHPEDDRVFSIRELMLMMSVPKEFKWSRLSLDELNNLPIQEKETFLKKEEINIRQSLGEAVPTEIFRQIAHNIKESLSYNHLDNKSTIKFVKDTKIKSINELIDFINTNPNNYSLSTLGHIAELLNSKRTELSAYYTNKFLITKIMNELPIIENNEINILEPSCGVGNFIPLIAKCFDGKKLNIDIIDIDENSLEIAKALLNKYSFSSNVKINYINADFLLYETDKKYDYIIGNPPFQKVSFNDKKLKLYLKEVVNKDTRNLCSFFLDKAIKMSNYVALVMPKFLLNTPEYYSSRKNLETKNIESIIDFGEKGFNGVLIETIALLINNKCKSPNTKVISMSKLILKNQSKKYIFDSKFPYWIIYRDSFFDKICDKLTFGKFYVFRDRQITNSLLSTNGDIRVIKSRNISDDGNKIIDIDGYDSFIKKEVAVNLKVYEYISADVAYLAPNMTYKPRLIKKPKGCLVNGSVAILFLKESESITEKQLSYIASDEFRKFYEIARNYQTRSLNIDSLSVFFFGLLKEEDK